MMLPTKSEVMVTLLGIMLSLSRVLLITCVLFWSAVFLLTPLVFIYWMLT